MKIAMSDQTKHRVFGVLVLASLAAIFLPAVLKKSNRNFEKNIKIALKLPTKPSLPKVDLPTDREVFNSVQVVEAKEVKVAKIHKNSLIAKAEPLEVKKLRSKNSNIASVDHKYFQSDSKLINVAKSQNNIPQEMVFSIQVATFTQKSNANILVDKLKNNGFNASYIKFKGDTGVVYRVVVGKVSERKDAVDIQKKLASSMQLNGFIIKSEVS